MDGQDLSGFEGNETGNGQGLAYVLPQSRSVGYFMQLANEKAQETRDNAAALQQQQQKANEQNAQDFYNYHTPKIANEYTQWMQPQLNSYVKDAADFNAKTNGDYFRTPQGVQRRNDLETTANATQEKHLQMTQYATQIADRSKNYTPESKQAGIDYVNGYAKDPVNSLYTSPPPLIERDLDLNDAIKLGHATADVSSQNGYTITAPNRHNHIVQGQAILSQPEFAPYLQSQGINPTVGDIGGIPNGTGGTVYPTDAPTVNTIADHIIQNAGQPHYAQTLAAAGIDPNDPHAKDKLTDLVTRQNSGYGKVLSGFADRLDANVEQKKVPDYNPERIEQGWMRIQDAEERHADAMAKKAKNNAAIDPQDISSVPYATNNQDSGGGFNINARNFVPVKSSDVPFGANPDIDLTNGGKPQNLSPLSKFSIAGVGDFPLYKTSSGDIQAGTPVSAKTEDANNKYGQVNYKRMVVLEGKDPNDNTKTVNYLMDYNKIPANVKNAKSFQEAVSKFDNTPIYGTQSQPTNSPKQIKSQNDYNSLQKGSQYIDPNDGKIYIKQ